MPFLNYLGVGVDAEVALEFHRQRQRRPKVFASRLLNKALYGAEKESEIPNFKGSYLGRFPLVSADFWTSDHLLERSRSVDAFSGTRARETLTLKRT